MSSLPASVVMGMHRFDSLDPMLPTEVNENTDLTDLIPVTFCLSSARPTTNLFPGRRIYETDTTRTLYYNGSVWRVESQREMQAFNVGWNNGGGSAIVIGSGGVMQGYFKQVGDVVDFEVLIVRVAATNVGTTWYGFNFPVPPADYRAVFGHGFVSYGTNAVMNFECMAVNSSVMILVTQGTSLATTRISNTLPGGWSGGEIITYSGRYKAAAAI